MSDSQAPAIDPLPPRWLFGIAGGVLVFGLVLTWLFVRAEAIAPETHYEYLHELRNLREADAEANAELLASRLELTRNYDALTRQLGLALAAGERAQRLPDFLSGPAAREVLTAAGSLRGTLDDKARLIESFKRDNAVARNSLAFFPVLAEEILSGWIGAGAQAVGAYVRQVLAFAREPGDDRLRAVEAAWRRVDVLALPEAHRRTVANLHLHGEAITRYLTATDAQTRQILALPTGAQLEMLNYRYGKAHAEAVHQAERYRRLLYVVALMLTGYLAFTFVKLDRTRRSLTKANREIGERYAAQLQAESSLRLHATAFRNAHDGITLTDADGNIVDVNPAFTRITGFERSEVIGRNPRVLKSGRHDRAFYAAMWKSLLENGNWRGEIWNRNKYGEVYPELLSISAVRDATSRLTNYVAVFADISRLKEQEHKLTQLAYYDALTELPNRSLLADRMVQAMSQTRRQGNVLMAVCYLDLDGFKPVNDSWGHEVGDQLLVEMARRLRDTLRGGDTVARLGGDEFVLLLLGLESEEECIQAMQRLQRTISQPLGVTPTPVSLSASIGVALFPRDDCDADTLLRHADQAMYQAKQAGKSCYHLFDPEQDRDARTRQDNLTRLHEALERDEFVLYFQPKVDMRQGVAVGAEALIRWRHPELGLVPPMDFLPLIEDHDLIVQIGRWVIDKALATMAGWRAAGLDLPVSVNVAGRQLQDGNFIQNLRESLARQPGVAGQLELEVLETTALEDIAKVSQVIEECRALGVAFALDDFGTGYSSLTYLKRLPADTIKIDQSFVREMLNDPHNLVIVQGILSLASAFQRKVIAEGVETAEHGRLLIQLNCEQAQGYGIAMPMPAEDIPGWVATWRPAPEWQDCREHYWEVEDYPMLIAEVEHRNWIAQLIYAIREGQPVPHQRMADHRHCRYGTWYYGRGMREYGDWPAFRRIEALHLRVHELADEIDQRWRNGQIEQARALLLPLVEQRDAILAAMRELEMAVGDGR